MKGQTGKKYYMKSIYELLKNYYKLNKSLCDIFDSNEDTNNLTFLLITVYECTWYMYVYIYVLYNSTCIMYCTNYITYIIGIT